jgi:hypothetical protein
VIFKNISKTDISDKFAGLRRFINADDANKADYVVRGKQIEFTERRTLAFPTEGGATQEFSLSDHSFKQICNEVRIPSKYLTTCPVSGRGSQKDQLEVRMEENKEKEYLIRVRKTQGHEIPGFVRAFLPGSYCAFDNRHMLEAVERSSKQIGEGLKIITTNAKDPRSLESMFHMRMIKSASFSIEGAKGSDAHNIGFHVKTSEVGSSHLSVDALVYRQVCSNGMMGWADSEVFSHAHKNFQLHELYPRVHEGIFSALRQEENVRDMLERSLAEAVRAPELEIQLFAKRMKLTDGVIELVLDEWKRSSVLKPTRFDVVQAFTRTAQNLPLQDRVSIETRIGKIMFGGGRVTNTSEENNNE